MRRLAGVLVLAALVAAGCGVGAGETPGETRLVVTDGFGAKTLLEKPDPDPQGEDTVMRLLQRNAEGGDEVRRRVRAVDRRARRAGARAGARSTGSTSSTA